MNDHPYLKMTIKIVPVLINFLVVFTCKEEQEYEERVQKFKYDARRHELSLKAHRSVYTNRVGPF